MTNHPDHRRTLLAQFSRQAIPFSRLPAHSDAIALLTDMADPTAGDEVLDVACGSGLVACALARRATHVTGIDITPAMLDQARALQRKQQLNNLSWQLGEAYPLPFADHSFDIVLSRYSLHHMQAPAQALAEMVRVCRPGGRVLVADIAIPQACAQGFDRLEQWRDPSHVHALSEDEFAALFDTCALEDLQSADYTVRVALEEQLAASFPVEGGAELIRHSLQQDVGINALGVGAHLRDGQLYYDYPIRAVVGRRPLKPSPRQGSKPD